MAPKLTILLLVAFFFLVDASNTENPVDQETCRQQIQKQGILRQCQSYLTEQRDLRKCCNQLSSIDSNCICLGLSQLIRLIMQQGLVRGEGIAEAIGVARNLPTECNLLSTRCEIRGI
ncbi:2S seed storage albumin protein-like [Mercurialis annua]|uniref:2S seed storage albumin protein-like n=1 Tax=Mercurialis annua TaxID=3986 RepID=UPI002160073F|nr:2S seed storage albumin protein-like [Mercurialis annua]